MYSKNQRETFAGINAGLCSAGIHDFILDPRRFKVNKALCGKPDDNRNKNGYTGASSTQLYPYDHNQYYQGSNYYSHWSNDQNLSYNCSSSDYSNQALEDKNENASEELEVTSVYLDVAEANRQFMMDSEELYDALIECHWPALDFPDAPE